MKEWLKRYNLMKENYKGEVIPAGAGIIFIIILIIFLGFYYYFKLDILNISSRLIFLLSIITAISLVDDQIGKKDYQGFKGHFSQLRQGNLTTGALKAIIALILVLLIVNWQQHFFNVSIDVGIILLMTNLLNLLDLRPGRALKSFLFLSLILLVFLPPFFLYLVPIYLATCFYLPYELKGKVMLGDTGANSLGAFLGFGYSMWDNLLAKVLLLVLLITLTLLAEKYSFTKIIENNSILRYLDNLGR